jgi:hypothetical protein
MAGTVVKRVAMIIQENHTVDKCCCLVASARSSAIRQRPANSAME